MRIKYHIKLNVFLYLLTRTLRPPLKANIYPKKLCLIVAIGHKPTIFLFLKSFLYQLFPSKTKHTGHSQNKAFLSLQFPCFILCFIFLCNFYFSNKMSSSTGKQHKKGFLRPTKSVGSDFDKPSWNHVKIL